MEKKVKIVITENDNTSKTLLQSYLADVGTMETFAKLTDAFDFIVQSGPDFVIYDSDDNFDGDLVFIKRILSKHPSCKVIALSYNRNSNNIIKAMRAGVKEFLIKPILEKELLKTFENLESASSELDDYAKGKVISIFSNKDGIGTTSVAVNLAVELAKITREKTALVDLNFRSGDVSTFLDITPKFDIQYIFDNIENANEDYLYNLLVKYKTTNLFVLSDLPQNDYAHNIKPEQIENLIRKLKQHFTYIIVDTPANIDDASLAAMKLSNNVFVITISNLPALHNCQRTLALFTKYGLDSSRIKVILNRYIDSEITVEDIENMLDKKIFYRIPNNYIVQMNAINKGVSVSEIDADTNISKSFKNLAVHIVEKFM